MAPPSEHDEIQRRGGHNSGEASTSAPPCDGGHEEVSRCIEKRLFSVAVMKSRRRLLVFACLIRLAVPGALKAIRYSSIGCHGRVQNLVLQLTPWSLFHSLATSQPCAIVGSPGAYGGSLAFLNRQLVTQPSTLESFSDPPVPEVDEEAADDSVHAPLLLHQHSFSGRSVAGTTPMISGNRISDHESEPARQPVQDPPSRFVELLEQAIPQLLIVISSHIPARDSLLAGLQSEGSWTAAQSCLAASTL